MDISALTESVIFCKEEQDFFTWQRNSKNNQIHFGQKIKIKNSTYFIVGGTINGTIYCQSFPAKTPAFKIRYDEFRPKIILNWRIVLSMQH